MFLTSINLTAGEAALTLDVIAPGFEDDGFIADNAPDTEVAFFDTVLAALNPANKVDGQHVVKAPTAVLELMSLLLDEHARAMRENATDKALLTADRNEMRDTARTCEVLSAYIAGCA